jgi:hypothetical protein
MTLLAAVLALCAMAASAADINGKWTGQVPGRQGTQETTFTFKAPGAELTGTVTNQMGDQQITAGKVDGDNISFSTILNFNGNEITINYKGAVSGSEIKMTREVQGRGAGPQAFTLKKAS